MDDCEPFAALLLLKTCSAWRECTDSASVLSASAATVGWLAAAAVVFAVVGFVVVVVVVFPALLLGLAVV